MHYVIVLLFLQHFVRIQLAYFTISPLQWPKTEVALCYLYLYIAKMSTEKHKDSRKTRNNEDKPSFL